MQKIKIVVINFLIASFVLAAIMHLIFFRTKAFDISSFMPFLMEYAMVIAGPFSGFLLAAFFPQTFTYATAAIGCVIAAIIVWRLMRWFQSDVELNPLNKWLIFTWCLTGFIHAALLIGTGI